MAAGLRAFCATLVSTMCTGRGTSNEKRRLGAWVEDRRKAAWENAAKALSTWLTESVSTTESVMTSHIHTVPAASYWPVFAKASIMLLYCRTSRKPFNCAQPLASLIARGARSITSAGTVNPTFWLRFRKNARSVLSTKDFVTAAHFLRYWLWSTAVSISSKAVKEMGIAPAAAFLVSSAFFASRVSLASFASSVFVSVAAFAPSSSVSTSSSSLPSPATSVAPVAAGASSAGGAPGAACSAGGAQRAAGPDGAAAAAAAGCGPGSSSRCSATDESGAGAPSVLVSAASTFGGADALAAATASLSVLAAFAFRLKGALLNFN